MRDPDRIDRILTLVKELWKIDQDMRFFQLIYNLQGRFSHQNDGVGKVEKLDLYGHPAMGYDLFNAEDKDIQIFLKEYLDKRQNPNLDSY